MKYSKIIKEIAMADLRNSQPVEKMESLIDKYAKDENYETCIGIRDAIKDSKKKPQHRNAGENIH